MTNSPDVRLGERTTENFTVVFHLSFAKLDSAPTKR